MVLLAGSYAQNQSFRPLSDLFSSHASARDCFAPLTCMESLHPCMFLCTLFDLAALPPFRHQEEDADPAASAETIAQLRQEWNEEAARLEAQASAA
eukprot:5876712-Pleurochrysis_carterae.AAC.2